MSGERWRSSPWRYARKTLGVFGGTCSRAGGKFEADALL
jgi:hypothetical protein